jgi:DNA (cytosine-5)-methyltransferase 1
VPQSRRLAAVDWADAPPANIVTAGWPRQDISLAGQGAGIKEETRSGLCITACPRQVRHGAMFLRNVAAPGARGPARVLADLAALGYDAQWAALRARDVGTPHTRARLLVLAARPASLGRLAAAARPPGPRPPPRPAA